MFSHGALLRDALGADRSPSVLRIPRRGVVGEGGVRPRPVGCTLGPGCGNGFEGIRDPFASLSPASCVPATGGVVYHRVEICCAPSPPRGPPSDFPGSRPVVFPMGSVLSRSRRCSAVGARVTPPPRELELESCTRGGWARGATRPLSRRCVVGLRFASGGGLPAFLWATVGGCASPHSLSEDSCCAPRGIRQLLVRPFPRRGTHRRSCAPSDPLGSSAAGAALWWSLSLLCASPAVASHSVGPPPSPRALTDAVDLSGRGPRPRVPSEGWPVVSFAADLTMSGLTLCPPPVGRGDGRGRQSGASPEDVLPG